MSRFDNISIGERAELSHVVTEKDVDAFANLTGDDNKLHMEDSFASETSFKKRVVHGMLSASFISTIIGTKLPGNGALWYSQTIEFLLPVRIGDEIKVVAIVKSKNERTQSLEIQTDIFNQHGQTVLSGIANVKVVEPKTTNKNSTSVNKRSKVALVIGATGGIGYATCIELAKNGFKLAIHYNSNQSKAIGIQAELQKMEVESFICKSDICNAEQVKVMVEQVNRNLGAIEVLVNCSTIPVPSIAFKDLEWKHIQNHLEITIHGMYNLFMAVIPTMIEYKYGRIIALNTQATEMVPPKGWVGYVTAKSALSGLCKSMAVELAVSGITVNMVSPGMTDTDLIADMPEKAKLIAATKSPFKRLASAEDVAVAITFLAMEKASYITGETIRVNGGQVMI
jgi:3-oxoacyl-[acyl-carrier protein] reductase